MPTAKPRYTLDALVHLGGSIFDRQVRPALYTPPSDPHAAGSWAAGSTFPSSLGAWDAPGAMMPNGKVLLAVGPQHYGTPTTIFEYDPGTNALTQVSSPSFGGPAFVGRMLMLPTGQVLWTNGNNQLYVYTPDGSPDPSWKPTITDVTDNGDGSFLLTGTQLNGISEGAAYGDDAEMSSNYPLVQLADGNGNVWYAPTSYWSNTGVATGDTPVSTYFTLPGGIAPGTYSLSVVVNGIASDLVDFTIGAGPGTGHGRVNLGATAFVDVKTETRSAPAPMANPLPVDETGIRLDAAFRFTAENGTIGDHQVVLSTGGRVLSNAAGAELRLAVVRATGFMTDSASLAGQRNLGQMAESATPRLEAVREMAPLSGTALDVLFVAEVI